MSDYLNFDLELSGYNAAEDSFLIRAARVPGIDAQKQPQKALISKTFREQLPALAFRDLARAELVELGSEIGNALLPGGQAGDQSVRELFFKARDRLQNGDKLRLRLKINEIDNFALATLPWEFAFLRDSNTPISQAQISDFLALDQRISIVRSEVLTGESLKQYPPVNGPIGLLALLISPTTAAKFPELDLKPEQAAIQAVVEKLGSRVHASYLNAINGDTGLQRLFLNNKDTQILHFAGHGYFAREMGDTLGQLVGRGGLVLADDQGEARLISVDTLVPILRGRDLRLVVLAACEGAQRDAVNAWSGVAPALIRAGIPAVVGMQYSISNTNATQFSDLFYTALTLGSGVDEALYEARLAMSQAGDSALQAEFGFPALYLRIADEQSELVLFPAQTAAATATDVEAKPKPVESSISPNSSNKSVFPIPPMPDKVTLRTFIAANFKLRDGDFDLLCENLSEKFKAKGVKISMDDIGGNTAPIAALNLISYMDRRGWLPYLVEEVRAERPDVPL